MTLTDVLFLFANPHRSENKIPPDSVESKRIGEGGGREGDDTSKTVGVIDAGIIQALKVRGIEPFSADISITDKQLIHLSRAVKQTLGQQVDLNTIKHLPDRLANADVLLRSKNKNELIYAFKRPDGLYDKVAVNLQRKFLKDTLQKALFNILLKLTHRRLKKLKPSRVSVKTNLCATSKNENDRLENFVPKTIKAAEICGFLWWS